MDLQALLDLDTQILRWFNGSDNLFVDQLAVVLTNGFTWLPLYLVLLYLVIKNNETMSQIMLIVGCSLLCIILADGLADFIAKPYFARWRPSNDPMLKYSIDIVDNIRGGDYGFFSAHAANTMSLTVFFCLLVRNRIFSVFMVAWSLMNCWTRLYLGLHYPGDILVGLLWGVIAGLVAYYCFYKIFFKISPKIQYVSTQYTSSGYSISDIDMVLAVMSLTFVLALIYSLTLQ